MSDQLPDLTNLPDNELVPVYSLRDGDPCTIRRYGEYDSLGRCDFFIDWKDGERNRGQSFFSRPDKHVMVAPAPVDRLISSPTGEREEGKEG